MPESRAWIGLGSRPLRRVLLKQAAPLGIHHFCHSLFPNERVPEPIVVEPRCKEGPGDDRAAQQDILQRLERAMIDHLLAATGEGVDALMEVEIHLGDVLADDFDLPHIAAAEASLMGQTDVAVSAPPVRGMFFSRYQRFHLWLPS